MRIIREEDIEQYIRYLYREEKSKSTREKYERDIKKLMIFADGREITKELLISYKEELLNCRKYKISSINSFLEAANRFFEYMEWYGLKIKPYKTQRQCFREDEEVLTAKEYRKLLRAALDNGNKRLYFILETLADTGIRISELRFITVDAVKKGIAIINNKGKIRKVMLSEELCRQLRLYIADKNILRGSVFVSKNGNPLNRSNIWKEMKVLAEVAGVKASKVYPHNLRRLFASSLYRSDKDIAKVADMLGHSRLDTTRLYIREGIEYYRKAIDKLGLTGKMEWIEKAS